MLSTLLGIQGDLARIARKLIAWHTPRQWVIRAVAAAMSKAHEILKYLGVNTDTDWLYILERLADPDKDRKTRAKANA